MEFRFNFCEDGSEAKREVEIPHCPLGGAVVTFGLNEFLKTWDPSLLRVNDVIALKNEWKIFFAVAPPCGDVAEVTRRSDVVPGTYEGGLKVWECSLDLANYLISAQVDVKDKVVFEIGCGVGIPGVVAAKHHPRFLLFQDFNEFVLRSSTAVTLLKNLNWNLDVINKNKVKFISGDWSDVQLDEKVDVILTSETIYERQNFAKLYHLIDRSLSRNGVVYLASKTVYFGVGGGIYDWNNFVTSRNEFDLRLVKRINASVAREVWMMKRASTVAIRDQRSMPGRDTF